MSVEWNLNKAYIISLENLYIQTLNSVLFKPCSFRQTLNI